MNQPFVYKEPEHTIDGILTDLAFYQHPELLKPEYRSAIETSTPRVDLIKKHFASLSSVKAAWQKILRYEVYFSEFYPTSKNIPVFESLNHHVHGYLQDMTILKNKIEVWLGEFKNDCKKEFENKKDIEEFYIAAIEKTREVFDDISKFRDPHHHKGSRFLDPDIFKAETAKFLSDAISNEKFPLPINQEALPAVLAKLEQNQSEAFEVAKQRWIETARKNGIQATGYLDHVLLLARPNLYRLLGTKLGREVFNQGVSQ